ncbi:RNA pseudouridylate synthase domain containing protein 2 [Actinomortierella wolfii]|nr:RNA pseudouridylate synthase domain containing protein 2 [Actinomortierella wolfii]
MPKAPSTSALKQVAKMASTTSGAAFTKPPRPRKSIPEPIPEITPEYYFEHGLRLIKPYRQTHLANVKGRWIGKTIPSVFASEMPRRCSESMIIKAMNRGDILINDQIVSPDYVLRGGERIRSNNCHRHEPAVPDTEIKVIEQTEDYLVFDKPHGITVHPNELCHFNSALEILRRSINIPKSFHAVNRLDGVTSGIVILANTADANIRARFQGKDSSVESIETAPEFKKEYLCRVVGEFPEAPVVCKEPIYQSAGKMSVDPRGKPSETKLERVWYDPASNTSLVRCYLSTGRQHQIRLHVAHLNHPIVNDILYNPVCNNEGSGASSDTSNSTRFYPPNIPPERQPYMPFYPDSDTPCFKCSEEELGHHLVNPSKMKIWLRAIRYSGPDWSFEAELPDWADPSVTE